MLKYNAARGSRNTIEAEASAEAAAFTRRHRIKRNSHSIPAREAPLNGEADDELPERGKGETGCLLLTMMKYPSECLASSCILTGGNEFQQRGNGSRSHRDIELKRDC